MNSGKRILLGQNQLAELGEEGKLYGQRPVGGGGDTRLELGQLGCRETHDIGERLAVDEKLVVWRLAQAARMVSADLDEIAEHVVVPDLQGFDAGRVGVAALQAGDEMPAAVAEVSLLVEIGAELFSDEAAVALIDG